MKNKLVIFCALWCILTCVSCSSLLDICEGINAVLDEAPSTQSSNAYNSAPVYNSYPVQEPEAVPQYKKATHKCGSCNGFGICARCNGTGKIDGFGVKDGKVCPVCRGLKKCQGCNGKGEY